MAGLLPNCLRHVFLAASIALQVQQASAQELPPIALKTVTEEVAFGLGFTTLAPTDWRRLAAGAYSRGNLATDQAMIIQQAAPNDFAPDAIEGFLAILGAPDTPPVPFMTLETETLDWTVETRRGTDRIVAVAPAFADATTYVVALRADEGEFDALIEALLLPILMAFSPLE